MKKIIALGVALCLTQAVIAQQKIITYLKNNRPVKDPAAADYRRVISATDQPGLFSLLEFYTDETPKTVGFVSSYEPRLVYEGLLKSYSRKGLIQSETTYRKGLKHGPASAYHKNGKLAVVRYYEPGPGGPGLSGSAGEKIIHAYDSTGKQLVKDGTGDFKDGDTEGHYENGLKDGLWKGTQAGCPYEEIFDKGQFKSGQVTLKNGKVQRYKNPEQRPEYDDGLDAFYAYLRSKIKFPPAANRSGVSNVSMITFVVDTDGTLTDIQFRNNYGFGIEDEIRRVLSQAPRWEPGRMHGVPVRVSYAIQLRMQD